MYVRIEDGKVEYVPFKGVESLKVVGMDTDGFYAVEEGGGTST